jgi:hypothetical protein
MYYHQPGLSIFNALSCDLSLSSSFRHHSSLRKMSVDIPTETGRRASKDAVDQGLTSDDDAAVLAKLGYKQELRR